MVKLNVGDELDVVIQGTGSKGDGFTKQDGYVIFVPNTEKGEKVKIQITKMLEKFGFAEVI